ncbi:dirigent protein 22-like [Silene latifolia]|uniref:dirigent protein 22-like n=1 Tax=Silene latifolia TaxID=37657 RepID=UPI003D78AEF5
MSLLHFPSIILLLTLIIFPTTNAIFSRRITKEEFNSNKQQQQPDNLTHIQFYFHDYVTGPSPTALRIAQASSTAQSTSTFGALVMIDDPLTEGPDNSSKVIGYAQGMYGFADQKQLALLMTMNLVFSEGQFNGSTLSVMGRNSVMESVRELAVVGGSGLFRSATGYAQAKTVTFMDTNGATIVEYNVYVSH